MSRINGDKARYNRRRKMKIERRAKQRVMFVSSSTPAQPISGRSRAKSDEKSV